MARKRRKSGIKIPGLSFSMNRALGITKAKRKVAKYTGIPTSKSGRQKKAARALTGGCLIPISMMMLVLAAGLYFFVGV